MESIKVTIQFTPEDLHKAYALHLNKMRPVRSKVLLILGVIIILLGSLLLTLQSLTGLINWLSWFFIIYGILVIVFHFWRISRIGKSTYKKLVEFHDPFTFTINKEGVNVVGKTNSSQSDWEHYQSALLTPEMILLYPNKLRFVLLPKKYFTDEEYIQLTEWVREKVKNKYEYFKSPPNV